MSSLDVDALLSCIPSVQIGALTQFASHMSHIRNPSTERAFASLLQIIARHHPHPELREAVISMPHFPQSALSECLKDLHPSVRKATIEHPAMTASPILCHLVYENNERVIIACLSALNNLSDEHVLEALGVKHSNPISREEFYAVLRQCTEHHSQSVRAASVQPVSRLLQSKASAEAFKILEQLLCDVARVASVAVHAMLETSHKFRLSDRVVRALIALNSAGNKSALRLFCNFPCKTISSYAFLELYMQRKVYNVTSEERQEMSDIFNAIVVRNESFARVLDFGRDYPDKQWFWRGERHSDT